MDIGALGSVTIKLSDYRVDPAGYTSRGPEVTTHVHA